MSKVFFPRLQQLYADMDQEYSRVAWQIGLTCFGCPDNCCTSYFQHHTQVEWAYLWDGLQGLPDQEQEMIRAKAKRYVHTTREMIARQHVPKAMCPLNLEGLCTLYEHRLMICRLHGVSNQFSLPDGRAKIFPGCLRCQEILQDRAASPTLPLLDRTDFYRRLAALEMDYLRDLSGKPAKVRLTLAEMILQPPPRAKQKY
jgi:hypothetical protein